MTITVDWSKDKSKPPLTERERHLVLLALNSVSFVAIKAKIEEYFQAVEFYHQIGQTDFIEDTLIRASTLINLLPIDATYLEYQERYFAAWRAHHNTAQEKTS